MALRWALVGAIIAFPHAGSGQEWVADVSDRVAPAVFQVIGDYGAGSGFLYDAAGLILTNAHVTAGLDSVAVKIEPDHKVAGRVVFEDRRSDVAVVRIATEAVSGVQPLPVASEAFDGLRVGDELVIIGFPGVLGAVTTKGIVSQKTEGLLLTDAGASPGNSGGPALDADGRVVGITTFGTTPESGQGLQGAVSARAVVPMISGITLQGAAPPSDSLPTLPTDEFPLRVLEDAVLASDWPDDLYDISDAALGDGGDYSFSIATPPLVARQGSELGDLSQWRQEMGEFPPIVVVRVFPHVGQSTLGKLANIALAAIGAATDTYFLPVWAPESKGTIEGYRLQGPRGDVRPIQRRWSRVLRDGVQVTVLHLILSPEEFRPGPDGTVGPFVFNIHDDRGTRLWSVPQETADRIYEDFREYLGR